MNLLGKFYVNVHENATPALSICFLKFMSIITLVVLLSANENLKRETYA